MGLPAPKTTAPGISSDEKKEEEVPYKVLIVDDNEVNVKVLEIRLKKKKVEVACISDPKTAIAQIKENKFDLILLDLVMPEVSGLDILHEIRKESTPIELPIIIITAKVDSQDLVSAMETGANDFITKPIDFLVAWARIETHITIKRMHEDLEKKRQESINSARMGTLVDMAGSVAHEINNPLTIILGRVQLLMNTVEKGGPKEKVMKGLDNIFSSVLRVEGVVKGLRAFAQEEKSEDIKELNIKNLIDTTLNICRTNIEDAGIELNLEGIGNEAKFFGREGLFIQVFFHLFKNAKEAIENFDDKWISVETKVLDDHTQIIITDSGKGIDKEFQEKIFLPFWSSHGVGEASMGLGLSVSRGILEEHLGKIDYNPDSENTQFILWLPKEYKEEV